MILLKLLLVVQSFSLENSVKRTPMIVGLTTGSVLVEAERSGHFQFEVCDFHKNILLDEINAPELPCRSVTSEIQFASQATHDEFLSSVAHEYDSRLRKGLTESIFTGFGYGASSTLPLIALSMALKPRILTYISIIGGSLYLLHAWDKNFYSKSIKYDLLISSIEKSRGQLNTLCADDPQFLDSYVKSVKAVTARYLRAQSETKRPL